MLFKLYALTSNIRAYLMWKEAAGVYGKCGQICAPTHKIKQKGQSLMKLKYPVYQYHALTFLYYVTQSHILETVSHTHTVHCYSNQFIILFDFKAVNQQEKVCFLLILCCL